VRIEKPRRFGRNLNLLRIDIFSAPPKVAAVPTQVIAVANQKGGVGKTTTSVNLAACLAALGQRILLIDLDPQANATSGVGVEKTEGHSAYQPLLGEGGLEEKIKPTAYENLSIVPSELDMCGAEVEMSRLENHIQRFRSILEPIRNSGRFDLIVVDCPPALGVLTLNVFAATDWLLVPLQCEYYALEGISSINRIMNQLRDTGVNSDLKLLGVLMTMFDGRTRLAAQVVGEVRQHFGDLVFETLIPRTTRLAEAPSFGKPIIYYDKYSMGASAYEVFTEEVVKRLRAHGV
jgi:chromosome partitioning protein